MTQASYNDIAEWYDQFLRERPVYTEVILPNLLALVEEVEGEVICERQSVYRLCLCHGADHYS